MTIDALAFQIMARVQTVTNYFEQAIETNNVEHFTEEMIRMWAIMQFKKLNPSMPRPLEADEKKVEDKLN